MSEVSFPVLKPPRLKVVRAGQTWHVKLPGDRELTCMQGDEVTPRTVALRQMHDLEAEVLLGSRRFARADVVFVERVP